MKPTSKVPAAPKPIEKQIEEESDVLLDKYIKEEGEEEGGKRKVKVNQDRYPLVSAELVDEEPGPKASEKADDTSEEDSPEEIVHKAGFPEIAALIRWSQNYDSGNGSPLHLFLDLTGVSENVLGDTLFNYSNIGIVFGYTELGYLADALKEYVRTPDRANACLEAYLSYDPDASEEESGGEESEGGE